jgi:hypothetical protein
LRLYKQPSQQLLAERTYRSYTDDAARLYWERDAPRYEGGDESGADLGTIRLPSSLYDRLLAKLP